jgi:hypothetical protein
LGQSDEFVFQDLGEIKEKQLPFDYFRYNDDMKDTYYQAKLYRSKEAVEYERKIYSFLDLMGDLGGVLEAFTILIGFFILPIS